jgi:nickel-type superoxide dismutase maturation protease
MTKSTLFVEILLWVLGRRKRFVVSGASMEPNFFDGQTILIQRGNRNIQVDDVVLCHHPYQELVLVKRVKQIEGDYLFLVGDNPSQSTDSRHFGMVEREQIIGTVTAVIG